MTIAAKLTAINDAKLDIKDAIEAKGVTVGAAPLADYATKISEISGGGITTIPWERPAAWPAVSMPTGDDRIVGLIAVFPGEANFFACSISVSAGQYEIDFGDGTVVQVNSGTQYNYNFDYDNVNLTSDPSLSYKMAVVQIYPVNAGATFSSINLSAKHNQTGLTNGYLHAWLELKIKSNSNTILVGGTTGGRAAILQNIEIDAAGWNASNGLFGSTAFSLRKAVINVNNSFNYSCQSLFSGCYSLREITFNNNGTGKVNNTSSMFQSCSSLLEAPDFDTSAVTNMSNMFAGCNSLQVVPLYDTSIVGSMSGMFSSCATLYEVPAFNTSAVTNMNGMFTGCQSLRTIPAFDTSLVNNMGLMFQNCYSLRELPALSNAANPSMATMFSGCYSLQEAPNWSHNPGTSVNSTFRQCYALREVPPLDLSSVSSSSNFTNFVGTSPCIARIRATGARFTHTIASCTLSGEALDEYYTGLGTISGQTLTVTGNYGTTADDPTIATAKGWTVTGS